MVLLSRFWLAGWQEPARGSSGRAGAGAALWHARQDNWTTGQLWPELGSGTLARGHWPGPMAGDTAGAPWGEGSARASGANGADVPARPTPDSPGWTRWSSGVLYFSVWDAMLEQLELQPKQLMIEKEENGNTLKHGCVILQLCHRIPPQLFRLAERIIQ